MSCEKDKVKNYYELVARALVNVNKTDDMKLRFLLALNSGRVSLNHQVKKSIKKYQDDWLKEIEKTLFFLENIVFNPKQFIKHEELLVPIELAKKTSKESIQHLAANTHFIAEVDEKGDVRPEKILTISKDVDYSIYENRFIKMLVARLESFVHHRYEFITDKLDGLVENSFLVEMNVKLGDAKVKGKIQFDVEYNEEQEAAVEEYRKIVKRVDDVRLRMFNIKNTEFIRSLDDARPIVGPIQMTNILSKEKNYRECLNLWHYINRYNGPGFEIEVTQDIIPFDDHYKDEVYNMLLYTYASVKANSQRSYDDGFEKIIRRVKTFTPRIVKKFVEVEDDYLYEEEFKIPSKIVLLNDILAEQVRLEQELEYQKQIREKAEARLKNLIKLRDAKIKRAEALEVARLKRLEAKKERDRAKYERDKKLAIEREKRAKRREKNREIKQQQQVIDKIAKNIAMYQKGISDIESDELKLKEQIKLANDKVKHHRALIRKEENVEANKRSFYVNLFRYNDLRSKVSDGRLLKKQYAGTIVKLKKELENEQKIEQQLFKELGSI